MREKGQTEVAKTLETPVFSRGIEILTEKSEFSREDNVVSVKATGGFYSKVDLEIVKYHFEVGAKKDNFTWK